MVDPGRKGRGADNEIDAQRRIRLNEGGQLAEQASRDAGIASGVEAQVDDQLGGIVLSELLVQPLGEFSERLSLAGVLRAVVLEVQRLVAGEVLHPIVLLGAAQKER